MTQPSIFGPVGGGVVECSFCGESQPQVKKIVTGRNGVYICDQCIDLCVDILTVELPDEYTNDRARWAMAELLDEVGATARGEMPLPDRKQLAEWLVLLNRVSGSGAPND